MSSYNDCRVTFDVEGVMEIISWPREPRSYGFKNRVLVTGGRCYTSREILFETLSEYAAQNPISELAAGCATGADALALEWATNYNVPWRKYRADWDRYSENAGSRRNIAMLDHFQPDLVIAFPGNVGTTHCLRHARKRGITRQIVPHDGDWLEDATRWG